VKTLAELREWRQDADLFLGDPAASCGLAFFRYVSAGRIFDPDLIFSDEGNDLLLRYAHELVPLRVQISHGGPKMVAGLLQAFGIMTENFAERFVDHRNIGLTAKRVSEFPFHHGERRFNNRDRLQSVGGKGRDAT
jgi:hypothetical protein